MKSFILRLAAFVSGCFTVLTMAVPGAELPVTPLGITKFLPDPARPVIYAINQSAKNSGQVLEIDALTHLINRAVTVGKEPSDLDLTENGTQLIVLNTTTPSLSRIDLASFTVVETIPLADFSNRNDDFGGHVKCGKGSMVYYVDEQWGPRLRVFDTATKTVLQTLSAESGTSPDVSNNFGYGDIGLTPDRAKLFGWRQYGDGAGVGGTHAVRFTVNANGSLSGFAKSSDYSSANFTREPFNTPVLFTRDGSRLIIKDRVVDQTDLNAFPVVYPDEIYSVAPGSEIAVSSTAIFPGRGGEILYTLPVATTVQAILPDYSALVYFNATTKAIGWLDLVATLGASRMGLEILPADGAVVAQPSQLKWLPVTGSTRYQIYLGTTRSVVAAATPASPTFLGEAAGIRLALSVPLTQGQTYFWRAVPLNAAGQALGAGVVYSFTAASLTLSRSSITAETLQGAAIHPETITVDAATPQSWTASANVPWIRSVTPSGTTPGTLSAILDASTLAAGYHQGQLTVVSGGATVVIPVTLRVYPANFMIAKADLELPYVYVVSQESNAATTPSFLARINTATHQIEAAIPCGTSVTDLAIHYAENRIYLTNWKTGVLRAFDRSTFSQVQTYQFAPVGSIGYGEGGIWRVSAGKRGRIILEESDQWIDIRLIDTANGAVLATNSSEYAGDGDADPTGRYYYHSEGTSSNSVTRFDLSADTFVVMTPTGTASSGVVVMIPDGSKVAVGAKVFDAQLGLQYTLPAAVTAATLHGDLLFTGSKAYNGANALELASLPITATVMCVTGDQRRLYQFPANSKSFSVVDLTTIAVLPPRSLVPAIADSATVIGTDQRLSWGVEPFATSYQVYFGSDRDAVANATTASPEYLGTTQSAAWTGTLPTLVLDGKYYWRVDVIGYAGTNKGAVWSFNVAPLLVNPGKVELTLPVSAPVESRTLAISGPAGTAWSASTTTAWLSLPTPTGGTPGTLEVRLNPAGLAAGIYQGSIRVQAGSDTWNVPVSLELLTLNYTLAKADLDAPYVYAISQAASGTDDRAFLVVLDTRTNAVARVVPVGRSVTDFAIHYPENRIYLTNWKSGVLRALDRTSLSEVQTYQFTPAGVVGYASGDAFAVAAGRSGRIMVEDFDQWIDVKLYDTASGASLASGGYRQGGGVFEPTGRYYFHGEDNSSGAALQKLDTNGDKVASVTSKRVETYSYYGSRLVAICGDGSRVFWNGGVFDQNLNVLMQLSEEVVAATYHGEVLFTNTKAVNGSNSQILATLPVDTKIQAVSADQKKLFLFKAGVVTVVDLATVAALPPRGLVPGVPDGSTVIGTSQELSWLLEAAALSYDVYFGSSAAAVTAATKTSAEYLGNVTGTKWTGALPPLALGSSYYWRVDINGFNARTQGGTWSFGIAAMDVTPRAVKLAAPTGSPVPRQTLAMTADVATAWTATTNTPWITLRATSGSTPTNLQYDISTAGLTVGTKSGSITLQAAGKSFTVPVELSIVTLNVTKLVAHPNRPVVYALNTSLAGEGFCHLLEIDPVTAAIQRTLPIGFAPTDADLDPVTERLYISNWGYTQTRVIDVAAWTELPALNLGQDIYKLEITPTGKLITEGEDQWIALTLWNAATGANLATASTIREGDGQADPTGGFYYHCDNNSSGALLRKYNIAADTFVQTVAGPQIGYGSRNLILSGDGQRLFWLGRTFDPDLRTLATMPSNAEVHATNRTGELAVGASAVWWSDSGTQLVTLPFASTVAAVSANDAYLVRFNATTRALQSTAIATLTDLPGPWPRPGQILDQSPPRLTWSPVVGATEYRVYLAADAAALQAMTAPTATVATAAYEPAAALAFGRLFTWRVDAVVAGVVSTGKVQTFSVRFPQGPGLASSALTSGASAAAFADRSLLLGFGSSASGAQLYEFDPATGGTKAVQSFSIAGSYYDHYFGSSVALDAGKAAVGASARANPASGGGNAFLYRQGANGYWESSSPLAPPTPVANEGFGLGLATAGNLMLAGTGNTNSLIGRVVAYLTEPAAAQTQVFSAADGVAGDAFGKVIVMDGNRAIIAAPGAGSSYSRIPCLYAFSRSTATGLWSQSQKITIPGATSSSSAGSALAISGSLMATRVSSSAVAIYTQSGSNTWTHSATIASSAVTGASSSFGTALALDGEQLFVGDPGATYVGTSGGAVFSFRRNGTTWVPGPVITPNASRSGFGQALAARDGWLFVAGATGTVPASLFRILENANLRPSFEPGIPTQAVAGRAFSVPVRATDGDGKTGLAITKLQGPAWLTLVDNGGGEAVISGTPSGAAGSVADIQFRVSDPAGAQTLWTYRLTVLAPTALPTLTAEPVAADLGVGQELVLRAAVAGIGPFQWQWYRNGEPISGATRESLTIGEVALADAGSYQVRVANVVGEDVSAEVSLTVHPANRHAGDWPTFGGSPAHTGHHPAALEGCNFMPAWTQTVQSGSALNRAAIADGRAVIVPQGYFVTGLAAKAVDLATGRLLWSFPFPSSYSSNPPSLFNGRVYFQRGKGTGDTPQLFCLNAGTGTQLWASTYSAQWESYEAPAVAEQGVFVNGGSYGGIYGFNLDGSQRFFQSLAQVDGWTPTISNGRLFSWTQGSFIEHNPADGTKHWNLATTSGTGVAAIQGNAALLLGSGLGCIDLDRRAQRWQIAGGFTGSPAVGSGRVFAIQGNAVRSYALADGTPGVVYQTNAGSGALLSQPIVFNDRLVISSEAKTYVFRLVDGQLLQTLAAGGRLSYSNGYLLAAGSDGVLRAFIALNENAWLANLKLDDGTIIPEFAKATFEYITTVPFSTAAVTVTAATEDPAATVVVNGASPAVPVPLAVGNTRLDVRVTAEDGVTTKTYIINVTRLPQEFVFNAATDVPVTANGFATGGYPATLTLTYAPAPGTILTMVNNTGLSFITGAFANLAQGQKVSLAYGGNSYDFAVNYFGGTGNDLVLQWADTKVAAWGANSSGQLGDGTTIPRWQPSLSDASGVLAGKTVVAVAMGYLHSLALCADGSLAAWGHNMFGQLGNDSAVSGSVPVAVDRTGALAGKSVVAISAGPFHNLALCSDGTVVAWGNNTYGQLGDGTTVTRRVPVRVSPVGALAGNQVVAVAAAAYSSFALCDDGTVAAWGFNDDGELGNGTTVTSLVPVMVTTTGALSGKRVAALAAGQYHMLALCTDGTLVAWGYNKRGQLGNDSLAASSQPVAIGSFGALAGKTPVGISAGAYHSLARCADGTVAAWGANPFGQLGVAGMAQSMLPVAVNLAAVTQLAAGGSHSLACGADGTLFAWGDNADGQLGDTTTTSRAAPAAVDFSTVAAGTRVMAVANSAAARHTLALVALPAGTTQRGAASASATVAAAAAELLDEAFGLNRETGAGSLPQAQRTGDELVIRFTQPATATDIVYGAEWSTTLLPGTWQDVPDTGSGTEHRFAIPAAGLPQAFMRLKVTRR
jgi:alpha-tubulin suppressor-like RCC1 family protein